MYQKEKIHMKFRKIMTGDFRMQNLIRSFVNNPGNFNVQENNLIVLYSNGSISLLPAFHKSFSHNEQSLPERKNQAKFLKT